jgi:hypothetical protein
MRLRDWVREHREEIDRAVTSVPGMEGQTLNDEEREDWLRNDEGLYNWASRELGRQI